ncbi:DUF3021 domain-containing protein [Robertmurraya yapensis]|uniref:DUF3021 domain-containing protein n=2 Tax=Bacillaceae TaxID=186817 RepID=A0A3S0KTE6_9BACI|nr:DUF3021 domain-containing protein [Bacillus yapensis]RTR33996.1 DUF3021 domain-containing protein [Bacillus yapensis]TKS97314.1 DUF3021 domain-containing protein [Bacillus yapensis]
MKAFIFRSLIGIFFGGFIAVVFVNLNVLFGDFQTIDGSLFLKNSIGSLICGWFFTVSPMYFEIRKLKLSQQTILHFLTVIILYLILAIAIGWIPFSINSILLTLVIAIVVYTLFWISFYLYFKNQVRKINDDLKRI